ncbi:CheR family methyltransferase [Melittangium boletus]|uniref:CheR family methyltransferase n=1 Tax=Melittangium boletus TaxID=83453 RepID=UPI003DA6AFD3
MKDLGPLPLSSREFALFQSLVEDVAGIHLGPTKQALLVSRLSHRVRALGLPSFDAYHALVTTRGQEAERTRMLDCLCTNETQFFREPAHFEFLREHVFPEWTRRAERGLMARRVRVWSAGCSTGEEPYSLAMLLLERFAPESGWDVEVLATDLSTWALARAREGLWPVEKAGRIPPPLLRAFMLKGTRSQEGWMKAGPEVRDVLRFAQVNLNDERGWPPGPFELVFCRNVLIYFAAPARARTLSALLARLRPTGHLFLGHAESLTGGTGGVRCVAPNIYARLST